MGYRVIVICGGTVAQYEYFEELDDAREFARDELADPKNTDVQIWDENLQDWL
jgi:archaellum component FlaF (FlaF/FlaG flagellin family)